MWRLPIRRLVRSGGRRQLRQRGAGSLLYGHQESEAAYIVYVLICVVPHWPACLPHQALASACYYATYCSHDDDEQGEEDGSDADGDDEGAAWGRPLGPGSGAADGGTGGGAGFEGRMGGASEGGGLPVPPRVQPQHALYSFPWVVAGDVLCHVLSQRSAGPA